MSTHNICYCGEIRKMPTNFGQELYVLILSSIFIAKLKEETGVINLLSFLGI